MLNFEAYENVHLKCTPGHPRPLRFLNTSLSPLYDAVVYATFVI